jgi:hypothetical protein
MKIHFVWGFCMGAVYTGAVYTGLDPHNRQRVWALMQEVTFDSTVLLVRACSAPSPFSTQTVPWPF